MISQENKYVILYVEFSDINITLFFKGVVRYDNKNSDKRFWSYWSNGF